MVSADGIAYSLCGVEVDVDVNCFGDTAVSNEEARRRLAVSQVVASRRLRLFNVDWDDALGRGEEARNDSQVVVLHFSRVVTVGKDMSMKIWDADTGQLLQTFLPFEDSVESWCVFCPPGGRHFVTASEATVCVWSLDTFDCEFKFVEPLGIVSTVILSCDGSRLATVCEDPEFLSDTVRVWDDDRTMSVWDEVGEVSDMCFSPDAKRLATVSSFNMAQVWCTKSGSREYLFPPGRVAAYETADGHGLCTRVCFSPNGQRLATTAPNWKVLLWSLETGACEITLAGHEDHISAVCFSFDGRRVATGSDDGSAKIWSAELGVCKLTIKGDHGYGSNVHPGGVCAVGFSRDGGRLVTGAESGRASVWNASTGLVDVANVGHDGCVEFATFNEH